MCCLMHSGVDAEVCNDAVVLCLARARTRAQGKLTFRSITKVTRLPDSQPVKAPVHTEVWIVYILIVLEGIQWWRVYLQSMIIMLLNSGVDGPVNHR